MVSRTGGPSGGSVVDSITDEPAVSSDGHYMALQTRAMGPACLTGQCERQALNVA